MHNLKLNHSETQPEYIQTLPIKSLNLKYNKDRGVSHGKDCEQKVSMAALKEYNQSFSNFYEPKSTTRLQTLNQRSQNSLYFPQSGFQSANHNIFRQKKALRRTSQIGSATAFRGNNEILRKNQHTSFQPYRDRAENLVMTKSMQSLVSDVDNSEVECKELTFRQFAHKSSGFKTAIGSLRNSQFLQHPEYGTLQNMAFQSHTSIAEDQLLIRNNESGELFRNDQSRMNQKTLSMQRGKNHPINQTISVKNSSQYQSQQIRQKLRDSSHVLQDQVKVVSDQLSRIEQKRFSQEAIKDSFEQSSRIQASENYFGRKNGSLKAMNSSFAERKNRSFVKSRLFT